LSSIVTTEGIVHYEMDGRGEPVVLLHGWINSWAVWRETMIYLAEQQAYRVYALDFWGFGESAKEKTPPFKIRSYVSMVAQFLESMGIQGAPVVGHSMGGTVALSLALEHPERVHKVGVVWLVLAGDSTHIQHMIFRDVSRTSAESFFRSIGDLWHTDLSPRIGQIRVPTLGIFGVQDNIVNPNQAEILAASVPRSQIKMMPNSRHFPMLDEPEPFREALLSFLSNGHSQAR
jgi:pimeloyl-ACP methyl ester carboxylesterase